MGTRPSESELVSLAKSGNRVALGRLLLVHYDRLIQYLSPRLPVELRRHTGVEDVVQQTFTHVHRDIGRFEDRGDGSFEAWLKTIADHRLHDAIRRMRCEKRGGMRHRVEATDTATRAGLQLVDILPADDLTASRVMARRELDQAIQVAMAALPEEYRVAIKLRYVDRESLTEMARVLGRTEAAVRSMLDRAKKKLRDDLGRLSEYTTVRIYDAHNGEQLLAIRSQLGVGSVQWSPDSTYLGAMSGADARPQIGP